MSSTPDDPAGPRRRPAAVEASRPSGRLADRPPKSSGGPERRAAASHSTSKADVKRAPHDGQRRRSSPPHCGHAAGAPPRTPRSSAARDRSRGRTRPSRRASCGAPPGSSSSPWLVTPHRHPRDLTGSAARPARPRARCRAACRRPCWVARQVERVVVARRHKPRVKSRAPSPATMTKSYGIGTNSPTYGTKSTARRRSRAPRSSPARSRPPPRPRRGPPRRAEERRGEDVLDATDRRPVRRRDVVRDPPMSRMLRPSPGRAPRSRPRPRRSECPPGSRASSAGRRRRATPRASRPRSG